MMKRLAFLLFTFVAISSFAQEATTDSITANGRRLMTLLDSSRVEELWQKGYRVNWETGENVSVSNNPTTTHCSAFAAAFSKKVGVYILRPPEHGQILLANAQYNWLQTDQASQQGWVKVNSGLEAQNLANKGYLVVTVFKNVNERKPGHIAIIRPAIKTLKKLEREGPQTTQSGGTNAYSIALIDGFSHHPGAWPNGVIFYEHPIDWDNIK